MDNNSRKIVITILLVIAGICLVVGGTYAYLVVNKQDSSTIQGNTYSFNVSVSLTSIRSGNLIPTADNFINTSVNDSTNQCVDKRGYSLCSIYQLTLTNSGAAQTLNGYLKTASGTTYTTNHLKYQLFTRSGNTYTAATTAANIAYAANSQNYFTLNSSNITVSLADGSTTSQTMTYYLVIWLSDTGSNQVEDANKQFVGNVIFDSTDGNTISSQFLTT